MAKKQWSSGVRTVIFVGEGRSWIVVVKYGIFIVVGIRCVSGDVEVIDKGVRGCPHDFDIGSAAISADVWRWS